MKKPKTTGICDRCLEILVDELFKADHKNIKKRSNDTTSLFIMHLH